MAAASSGSGRSPQREAPRGSAAPPAPARPACAPAPLLLAERPVSTCERRVSGRGCTRMRRQRGADPPCWQQRGVPLRPRARARTPQHGWAWRQVRRVGRPSRRVARLQLRCRRALRAGAAPSWEALPPSLSGAAIARVSSTPLAHRERGSGRCSTHPPHGGAWHRSPCLLLLRLRQPRRRRPWWRLPHVGVSARAVVCGCTRFRHQLRGHACCQAQGIQTCSCCGRSSLGTQRAKARSAPR
jgi:hypothetical protein